MLRVNRQWIPLAAVASLTLGTTLRAPAADTTWTGAALNNLWADPANWSAGVPDAATNALLSSNVPADFTIDLGGINRPVASFSVAHGASTVHLVNGVPLTAGQLILTGGGRLSLDTPNDYAGGTRVQSGFLTAAAPGALGTGDVVFPSSHFLDLTAPNTTWQNQIAFNGSTFGLHVPATGVTLAKAPSGNGGLWFSGALRITGDSDSSSEYSFLLDHGTVLIDGTLNSKIGVSILYETSLPQRIGGSGAILGRLSAGNNAVVSPGDDGFAPGRLSAGRVTFENVFFKVDLAGSTPGTAYDQLAVTESLRLGANLAPAQPFLEVALATGFTPALGQTFTIIDNQFTGPVNGYFAGSNYPEGAIVPATNSPTLFRISYLGGDGNDITLTTVPEPALTLPLLLLAPLLRASRARRATRLTTK